MRHWGAPLLIASALLWGILFGGQLFNAMMTAPIWSTSPPGSLAQYRSLPAIGGLPFFVLFNPLFVLVAAAAATAAWTTARSSRVWLLGSVFCAIIASGFTIYMTPLLQGLFLHSASGSMPPEQIAAAVEWWKTLNWTRLVIEFSGFVASLIAIQAWQRDRYNPADPRTRSPLL